MVEHNKPKPYSGRKESQLVTIGNYETLSKFI